MNSKVVFTKGGAACSGPADNWPTSLQQGSKGAKTLMDRALIVDDSRAMRRILGSTIRELGFEISEAGNGLEALETLDGLDDSVKLILVDWNMPEMNGLEFVTELRKTRQQFSASKVMMVTTETGAEQMTQALEAGADEYMMKPFTKEVVVDKLRLLGLAS
jgi:two-component system chemotaxis response regulator CheY